MPVLIAFTSFITCDLEIHEITSWSHDMKALFTLSDADQNVVDGLIMWYLCLISDGIMARVLLFIVHERN